MPQFTITEQKILDVLSDGMAHNKQSLHACLPDDLTSIGTLRVHLTRMRKKLRPVGQDIIAETNRRRTFYRHIRLLTNPYRE